MSLVPQNFQLALPQVPGGYQGIQAPQNNLTQTANYGTNAISQLAQQLNVDISHSMRAYQKANYDQQSQENYALGQQDIQSQYSGLQQNKQSFLDAAKQGLVLDHKNPWRQLGRQVMAADLVANDLSSAAQLKFAENPLQDPNQVLGELSETYSQIKNGFNPRVANSRITPELLKTQNLLMAQSIKAKEEDFKAKTVEQATQLGFKAVTANLQTPDAIGPSLSSSLRQQQQLGQPMSVLNKQAGLGLINAALLQEDDGTAEKILNQVSRVETSPGNSLAGVPEVSKALLDAREEVATRRFKTNKLQLEVEALNKEKVTGQAHDQMILDSANPGGLKAIQDYKKQFPGADDVKLLSFREALENSTQTADDTTQSAGRTSELLGAVPTMDPEALKAQARTDYANGAIGPDQFRSVYSAADRETAKKDGLLKVSSIISNPTYNTFLASRTSAIGTTLSKSAAFAVTGNLADSTRVARKSYEDSVASEIVQNPTQYFEPDGKTPKYQALKDLMDRKAQVAAKNEELVAQGVLKPSELMVDRATAQFKAQQREVATFAGLKKQPWVTNDDAYKKAVDQYKAYHSGPIAQALNNLSDYYRYRGQQVPMYLRHTNTDVLRKFYQNQQLQASPATPGQTAKPDLRQRQPAIQHLRQKAEASGVNPQFAQAIMEQESGYQSGVTSRAGAHGYMQLMPQTAARLGVNRLDPAQNIAGGVKYLAILNQMFGGNPIQVAAAYNAGEGAVMDFLNGTNKTGKNPRQLKTKLGVPPWAETQNYVASVTRRYQRIASNV